MPEHRLSFFQHESRQSQPKAPLGGTDLGTRVTGPANRPPGTGEVRVKNNIPFTVAMLILSLIFAAKAARAAESSGDLQCRSKAKEVALQTYQGCVSEKTTRLKDLKQRYKERMAELKAEFQTQLDEINGKSTAPKAAVKPATKSEAQSQTKTGAKTAALKRASLKAEKPVSGVAKALPAKQNDNGPALPIQQQAANDDQAVVNLVPESATVEKSDIVEPEVTETPQL